MRKLQNGRIYYAQNREDLILEAFFGDVDKGFYVDIGACHPDEASVTKKFYLKGWRGINVEPQVNLYGLFVRDRKRDINLNVGLGDKKGRLTLRSYTYNQGLSSVVDSIKDEHESTAKHSDTFEDIEIEVTTLEDILSSHKVGVIHFLKVDVEGYEYEVLKGNNWEKFRPEVICIEANHVVKNWQKLLLKNKYEKVFFDGLNEYYADTLTNRAKKFDYVGHVVTSLRGGIASYDQEALDRYESEVLKRQKIIEELEGELLNIKGMLRRIVRLVPYKLRRKLGAMDQTRKK